MRQSKFEKEASIISVFLHQKCPPTCYVWNMRRTTLDMAIY